ncbi:MAG: hypothetical protein HKP56_00500 [Anderseniella sp.]|nr:hypothetical protein [Anderseniella sp.]
MKLYTKIPNASSSAGDFIRSVGYRRYYVSADLASMSDYTAISILEDEHVPAPRWGDGFKQLMLPRTLRVKQAFRLAKGTPYPDQVDYLERIMNDEALEGSAELWIDATGAGRAVSQLMDEKNVPHTGLVITSGDHWKKVNSAEYRVSKQYLLNKLNLAFATEEMKIAYNVIDREEVMKQLADYQVEITKAGNITMNAAAGQHDDHVISLGIAYFAAKHRDNVQMSVTPLSWR